MSPFSGGEFKVLHLKTNYDRDSFIHTKSGGFVRKKILVIGPVIRQFFYRITMRQQRAVRAVK